MRVLAPLLLFSLIACRNQVVDGPDAGVGEGEGEGDVGEGEGEGEGEDPCAGPPVTGIVVQVEDSLNFFRICGATVVISEGAFNETLVQRGSTAEDCEYAGANDRPGTYEINASATGYSPVTASNIPVEADAECGRPETRTVTMRLTSNSKG